MQKKVGFNHISPMTNTILTMGMGLVALLVLIPMALVVVVSFSSAESISQNGYSFFPSQWTLAAYQNLITTGTQIGRSYLMTITHTALGTVCSLSVMSMFAYVLAQPAFPAKKFYTFFLFFTMLFSGGLVPSYIVNTRILHLYDNFWIFILPTMVNAFNVIILRTFIQTTIPPSLFEAAKIDGANDFTIFFRIVLPLFKAALATVALFSVVARWNDWFTGMLYIENPRLVPLQTMLTSIQNNIDFIKQNADVASSIDAQEMLKALPSESARMAIVVLSTAPILFAYPFFQRYFVEGMTVGSVKG
ncbi:MAG: carbohydrate ABC transporter permease [Angelakisella sp.]